MISLFSCCKLQARLISSSYEDYLGMILSELLSGILLTYVRKQDQLLLPLYAMEITHESRACSGSTSYGSTMLEVSSAYPNQGVSTQNINTELNLGKFFGCPSILLLNHPLKSVQKIKSICSLFEFIPSLAAQNRKELPESMDSVHGLKKVLVHYILLWLVQSQSSKVLARTTLRLSTLATNSQGWVSTLLKSY